MHCKHLDFRIQSAVATLIVLQFGFWFKITINLRPEEFKTCYLKNRKIMIFVVHLLQTAPFVDLFSPLLFHLQHVCSMHHVYQVDCEHVTAINGMSMRVCFLTSF